jgi:uncharacterized protein YegP (UPF0339 family)
LVAGASSGPPIGHPEKAKGVADCRGHQIKNPTPTGRIDSLVEFHGTGAAIALKSALRHLRKEQMKTTFEIKRSADGRFMFNLKAANDQVILTSQIYETKENAEQGIASVKQNAPLDERYEEKVGTDGAPYFVLHAGNHLVIGRSEMYSSREAMHKGIASVKKNAAAAETVDLSTHVPA